MDDEVLGCGGTIARHVKEGDQVAVCIVSNRAYGHQYDTKLIEREQDACRKAKEVLSYHELFFLRFSCILQDLMGQHFSVLICNRYIF